MRGYLHRSVSKWDVGLNEVIENGGKENFKPLATYVFCAQTFCLRICEATIQINQARKFCGQNTNSRYFWRTLYS